MVKELSPLYIKEEKYVAPLTFKSMYDPVIRQYRDEQAMITCQVMGAIWRQENEEFQREVAARNAVKERNNQQKAEGNKIA